MTTKNNLLLSFCLICVILIVGCSSGPVKLSTAEIVDVDYHRGRPVTGGACGLQLLILIPIGTNGRFQRAYDELVNMVGGDYLGDIEIRERWWYAYLGTVHCTELVATAYPKIQRLQRDLSND